MMNDDLLIEKFQNKWIRHGGDRGIPEWQMNTGSNESTLIHGKNVIGLETYFVDKFTREFLDQGVDLLFEEVTYHSTLPVLKEVILSKMADFEGYVQQYQLSKSRCILVLNSVEMDDKSLVILKKETSNTVSATYHYGISAPLLEELVGDTMKVPDTIVSWVYSEYGDSVDIPLDRNERFPIDEMYPHLNGESVTDYFERFFHSSSSILLLIGPPGTGKTTFIRGLLTHLNVSAYITYDEKLMKKDQFFADYMSSDKEVLILEDADNFLRPRDEGNDVMHKFLNMSDGLVTRLGKKMIFSTNLPSVDDIDSALIRPGRCFDVFKFNTLNKEQSKKLSDKVGSTLDLSTKPEWTVAEIFNGVDGRKNIVDKRKFGFY